jgi:hypothetical protein
MSAYHAWYLSLAAFLLVASPWSAQAQEEAQVKMIYAVWANPTAAENTLKHMNKGSDGSLRHPDQRQGRQGGCYAEVS